MRSTSPGHPDTTPFPNRDDFDEAVTAVINAGAAYHNTDTALMDDGEHDRLLARITATHRLHPDWDDHAVLTTVAPGAVAGDVRHPTPMLILDKVTTAEQVAAFIARLDGANAVVELKIDGLAVRGRCKRSPSTRGLRNSTPWWCGRATAAPRCTGDPVTRTRRSCWNCGSRPADVVGEGGARRA